MAERLQEREQPLDRELLQLLAHQVRHHRLRGAEQFRRLHLCQPTLAEDVGDVAHQL
jgi:hypothetical protein